MVSPHIKPWPFPNSRGQTKGTKLQVELIPDGKMVD